MSLALRDDRAETSAFVCTCHGEHLLGRYDARGIYLFCRHCKSEHCIHWRQILRLFLQFLPLVTGNRAQTCSVIPIDKGETSSLE